MDDFILNKYDHLVGDSNYNIVYGICNARFFFNKEWQIMLGLHLILVTLYGWITISFEQDKSNWWL